MASWHNTAKPSGPAVEVNAAVVPGSNTLLPGETLLGQPGEESAEAIVASSEPGAEKGPERRTPEDSMS